MSLGNLDGEFHTAGGHPSDPSAGLAVSGVPGVKLRSRLPVGRSSLDQRRQSLIASDPVFNGSIDRANRIVFADVVVQAFGQQCDLVSVCTFNESLHPAPDR